MEQRDRTIAADIEGLGLTPKRGESWVPFPALHKSKGAPVSGRPQMHSELEADLPKIIVNKSC